jgi:hypothetical protein
MKKMASVAVVVTMAVGAAASAQEVIVQAPVRTRLELQMGGSLVTVGQVKDDLFGDTSKFAAGASDVTEINLGPKTMGMVGETHGKEGELAKKMKTMVIHTYKYDRPGMYKMEDFDAYSKKLENGSWSCSVHLRNKMSSTDICSRTAPDQVTNEMVILTAEPTEVTFIHMSGEMSLDELEDMSGHASRDADRLNRKVKPSYQYYPPAPPIPSVAPVVPKVKPVPPDSSSPPSM